ncbi:MAG TPA: DNA repair exonuclease [Firmicutes bacterium]|nr:DNA repair exonuclease [Bacillota bacterium]
MKRIVITGDIHYKGVNPKARLDNYQEAITEKLREVYIIAQAKKADAIAIPGDLTHSPNLAWGTVADLAMLLKEAPCPVLTIDGNHDGWGGNPASKIRTPYGLLARLGLVWDLTEEPFEINHNENDHEFNIAITGHSFTADTDTEAGKDQFFPPPHLGEWGERGDRVSIHVVHSMLMDHAPGHDMRHTLISQVETTANVIISGHDHTGFGVIRRDDGVLFINPGALCRLSAHASEIERQVQVAVLTINDDGQYSAELVSLLNARPGDQVLSREHIEEAQARNEKLDEFLSLLASEGESKFLEVRDIVEDIAARENIPANVKAETLGRIGRARERVAKSEVAG